MHEGVRNLSSVLMPVRVVDGDTGNTGNTERSGTEQQGDSAARCG